MNELELLHSTNALLVTIVVSVGLLIVSTTMGLAQICAELRKLNQEKEASKDNV